LNLIRPAVVLSLALPVWAQYAGPAILSRGEAPAAMKGAPIAFRPFVELNGIYDTGLTGVAIQNNQGDLASDKAFGVELGGGVSGSHNWRHTALGLDYRGSFRHYSKKTYFDGTDQALNLGLSHQLSRHVMFNLRQSAGSFSRDFGLAASLQSTIPFDPVASYLPNTDFFDNRTLYLSSQADITYQRSARLSFNGGGDYFTAKRRSKALYGITGQSARGDVQYRIGRYTTIGTAYSYSRYSFSKGFGGSDIHNLVGSFAIRLTKQLEFSSYVGAYRAETKFIQAVQIDPVIAAIIGQSTGARIVHRIDTSPAVGMRLSRTFRKSVATLAFTRNATPGNGLFLTSSTNSVDGQLGYNGFKYWSASASAGYQFSDVISNVVGSYKSYSAGGSVGRRIFPATHLRLTFMARRYDSGTFSRYDRLIYRGTIGISFSPGDLPVRIW
jgi:hypothetical protein